MSKTYGFVDVPRHILLRDTEGVFLDIFIDGECVTNRCINADDEKGYVTLFKKSKDGKRILELDGAELARETRQGKVEFRDRGIAYCNELKTFVEDEKKGGEK